LENTEKHSAIDGSVVGGGEYSLKTDFKFKENM
jgi:hypothetical protein